ncbi:MAG: amidohydrolase family protein [Chloroflexi bacterium]|nr:amidohydrolase family protein [Chloroflexota bacterium]
MNGDYDLLIKRTTVVDGTGDRAFNADVGVVSDTIAAIGDLGDSAALVIDGAGLITSPGFIDPHSHADTSLLVCPGADSLVMQGVTTFVGGNCGFSLAPLADAVGFRDVTAMWGIDPAVQWRTFADWLSQVEALGISINYAPLVGHNTVRGAVLGTDWRRRARTAEINRMAGLIREAMESGVHGLSVGLDASWSGHFAAVEEIVELAKVAGEYGGFFAPHTRHHQNQWPAENPDEYGYGIFHGPKGDIITGRYHGLIEAVEIARAARGIPLHIAHLTPAYLIPQPHPAFLDEAAAQATLADIVDRACHEGLKVTYDVIAWSQTVGSCVPIIKSFLGAQPYQPDWLAVLGRAEFVEKLKDNAFKADLIEFVCSGKFKFGMLHPLTDPYWMDCYRILECRNSDYVGRTLGELARERFPHRILDAVYVGAFEVLFDVLLDDPDATWALIVDKREYGAIPVFLRHPAGMPCSDVQAFAAEQSHPEALYGYGNAPIAYGLFPYYLRHYVRETRTLTLEEAIKKCTSIPAECYLGLRDRGRIEVGARADIVLFDPVTVSEGGDFLHPTRPPVGIEWVLVNGQVVCRQGRHTGARAGRVLRRATTG